MQGKIKSIVIRVVALLLFAAVMASVILWQAGVYDISFIRRPAITEPAETTNDGDGQEPPDTSEDPPNTDSGDNGGEATTQPTTTASEDEKFDMLNNIATLGTGDGSGLKVSSAVYGAGSTIARVNFKLSWLNKQSYHTIKGTERKVVQNSDGLFVEKDVKFSRAIPAIRLYYGFRLIDVGKYYTLYSPSGAVLIENFKGELVYARSIYGNPVVSVNGVYYELSASRGLGNKLDESEILRQYVDVDAPRYYSSSGSYDYVPYWDYRDIYVEVTPSGGEEGDTDVTDPSETDPSETDPSETDPSETDPSETLPPSSGDGSQSGDSSQGGQTNPPETDSLPNETEPSDTEGGDAAETKPAQTEPPSGDDSSQGGQEKETESSGAADGGELLQIAEDGGYSSVVGSYEMMLPSQSYAQDGSAKAVGANIQPRLPSGLPDGAVEIDGKYYVIESQPRWGFKDKSGNVVIDAKYKSVYRFSSNGFAAVTDEEDRLLYINSKGEEVITLVPNELIHPEEYGNIPYRQSYRTAVSTDIDALGMYYFDNGYVMVRRILTGQRSIKKMYENKLLLLDESGRSFNIPNGYELVNYSEGILLLKRDGRYGYMTLNGGWLQSPQFVSASPFVQGVAVVRDNSGKYGLINLYGEYVLPTSFDYVSSASSGYITTYSAARGWEIYCIATK